MRQDLRQAFHRQGLACQSLGSAFTARLMQVLPDALPAAPLLSQLCDDWTGDVGPSGASLPLRLAGGLHALVMEGRVPALAACYPPRLRAGLDEAAAAALAEWDVWLCDWVQRPPQTNETGRSAVLLPAALALAAQTGLPLRLSELGASAGLNLNFDRYRLSIWDRNFGPDLGVILRPDWQRDLPAPAELQVVERRGVDLTPLDAAKDGARLMAYVWPDQTERKARLSAALAIAREHPPEVDQGDAAAWLDARLKNPVPATCHIVFHTVAHQYFPVETQRHIRTAIEQAGARARPDTPLAWVGMEADEDPNGAALTLRFWPGNLSFSLGRAGFHGQWVNWRQPF